MSSERPITLEAPINDRFDGHLTLRLLGSPCLCRTDADGGQQVVLGVGKPLALLTYLAVSPQHDATREFLADLLWGADSVADPAHSLRNALVSLRNVVGPDVIDATLSRCRLARPIHSDLDALGEALREGRLGDMVAIYTGEFFAGFAAPGCQQFELWCDSVRHRVRTEVANAADVLVRQLLDAGHARDATKVARRMAEIEPFHQRARRALLEALIAAGDDLGALTEAAVLEQWLQAEELEADPATLVLIAQARKGRNGGRHVQVETRGALTPDLVGREAEFAAIVAAWERTRNGGPEFIELTAGAGVGKSRLLADAANRLRAERARVVTVGALPGERDLPFALVAVLVGALAPLVDVASVSKSTARVLASIDPSLAERYGVAPDTSATDQVLRRAFALRELLSSVAERRAAAVFIDDLHWADEASVDTILAALTRLDDVRALFVTASRPGGRHPLPSERAKLVSLVPLSIEQLGQLVASVRPLPNQAWAADVSRGLHVASSGIPLFAILALRGAEDAGLLVAGQAEWECRDPLALMRYLTQGTVLSHSLRDLPPRAARLLALLALAGRAVPVAFLRESEEPASGDDGALAELERRALIVRHGDRCSIAHDLVTEATLASLSGAHRAQWGRELGFAMLATGEQRWMERAVRLLAEIAPPDELALRIAPLLAAQPSSRGVSMEHLFASWLGQTPQHQAYAVALARALPVTVRLRPFRRRLLAAGTMAIGVLAVTAWRLANPAPQPEAELRLVIVGPGTERRVLEAPLRSDGWNAATLLPGHARAEATGVPGELVNRDGPFVSYTARATLAEQVFADSGGSEVVRIDAVGHRTRLTSARGDDVPQSWSPDGRFVAFTSSRWSVPRHHHAAILEVATGTIRRLSSGEGRVGTVRWSPDGSRLAFARTFLDGRAAMLCVVDFDGRRERCLRSNPAEAMEVLGWLDDARLLVHRTRAGERSEVLTLAADSAWSEHLVLAASWEPTLSPNREWLAWRADAEARSPVRVAPTADVSRARTLSLNGMAMASGTLGWTSRGKPAPFIEALLFDAPADTVFVGVPHRAPVLARWSDGGHSPVARLTWFLDDSSTARVDSLGTIVARREGPIVLRVSVGGWRTARHTFLAVPRRDSVVVSEAWTRGTGAWRLFGDPQPQIIEDRALGTALSNEGDGAYFSGAYHKQPFSAHRGLAVEAVVRTPITEMQWQSLLLDLHAFNEPSNLERWDHRSGYLPQPATTSGLASCGLQYPFNEGADGRRSAVLFSDVVPRTLPDLRSLARGAAWRIRIQVFPDGRCGVAVNGQPLVTSNLRFEPGLALLLVTYGNSWRSRMLLGPVAVSEGVPGDIDWTVVGNTPPRTTPRTPK